VSREPHAGGCLRHRRYQLDCSEFVILLAETGARCGICGISGAEARPAYLVIDHDHDVGDWAVRGMLCSGCNRRIRGSRVPGPSAAAYLTEPWYLRRFAARGISLEPLPEPPAGTIVGGRSGYWHRTERGWEAVHPRLYGAPRSWQGLNHLLGPHNIWIPPRTDSRYSLIRSHGRLIADADEDGTA